MLNSSSNLALAILTLWLVSKGVVGDPEESLFCISECNTCPTICPPPSKPPPFVQQPPPSSFLPPVTNSDGSNSKDDSPTPAGKERDFSYPYYYLYTSEANLPRFNPLLMVCLILMSSFVHSILVISNISFVSSIH